MHFTLLSPNEISLELGSRVRALRLAHGWTQAELAARAGVALDTLKKFERTGQLSLERFVRLVIALGTGRELEGLLSNSVPSSLQMLEQPKRQRGRSRSRSESVQ